MSKTAIEFGNGADIGTPTRRKALSHVEPDLIRIEGLREFVELIRQLISGVTAEQDAQIGTHEDDLQASLKDLRIRATKKLGNGTTITVEIGRGDRRVNWSRRIRWLLVVLAAAAAGIGVAKWSSVLEAVAALRAIFGL